MRVTILLTAATGALAGFFNADNYEKFKGKLEEGHNYLLDKAGNVRDDAFDLWDASELSDWLKYHKIRSPGANNYGALVAAARENKDKLLSDLEDLRAHPPPSEKILTKGAEYFEQGKKSAVDTWSDSALYEFLQARGQDVRNIKDRAKLIELVEQSKSLAADTKSQVSRYWFDSWTHKELESALKSLGKSAKGSRAKLADALWAEYESVKKSAEKGKKKGVKDAEKFYQAAAKWRKDTFDKWSVEDLKEYLGKFGPSEPSKKDQLVRQAREKWNYFVYGETAPKTLFDHVKYYSGLLGSHIGYVFKSLFGKVQQFNQDL